ncbi:hypothetical protein ACS0PU_006959 [Formica fusca]
MRSFGQALTTPVGPLRGGERRVAFSQGVRGSQQRKMRFSKRRVENEATAERRFWTAACHPERKAIAAVIRPRRCGVTLSIRIQIIQRFGCEPLGTLKGATRNRENSRDNKKGKKGNTQVDVNPGKCYGRKVGHNGSFRK